MSEAQSFKNHARWDPMYHFFIMPAMLLNIIATGMWYRVHHNQYAHFGLWFIFMSVVLFLLALKARMYAVKVQDRVICLEERIRLATFATPSELVEFESLEPGQLIALRFASNPELPELARRAVREKLSRKQIKESIASWRADDARV
jgi:hypothetical protein